MKGIIVLHISLWNDITRASVRDDKEVRIGLCHAPQACDSEFLPPLRVRFDERVLTNLKNVRPDGPPEPPASQPSDHLPNEQEKRHQDDPSHAHPGHNRNPLNERSLGLTGEPHQCEQESQHPRIFNAQCQ